MNDTLLIRQSFIRHSFAILCAAIVVSAATLTTSRSVFAKQTANFVSQTIAQADLPKEAQATLALIQQGGPFPYKDKDGSTFGNREGALPKQPRGYYTEYTVKTRASRDRGAIRIIAGKGKTGSAQTSGEYYFTADHYATFKQITLKP
jgi:ribonuclease T1